VALGLACQQLDLLDPVARFCDEALPPHSIYAFLHRERESLFPDAVFADLFAVAGRRSVPPSVVATVMVLQRLEGLSDREAVDRFAFDVRWRYAAGVGGWDGSARPGFAHTVLVDMRERLRRSDRPDRIFEVALAAAREAGLLGRRRVLDSTPLYDAVATMDTITLIRSAIRGLLAVADAGLAAELRAVAGSGDDYATAGKPAIDWDDAAARDALIDSRAKDAAAMLAVLAGRRVDGRVDQAVRLLAAVTGQDLIDDADGTWRIARRVATDRMISTVDPDSRHGHKTAARGFDGFKGHLAVDPDSEIITATEVTAGNTGDADVAEDLLADVLTPGSADPNDQDDNSPVVYGDAAYGAGRLLHRLDAAGVANRVKVQPPPAVNGHFPKDRFTIDLPAGTVTCPAGQTARIRPVKHQRHAGIAEFGPACDTCPLASKCTQAKTGRTITIGHYETHLAAARDRLTDPVWKADYRATRPKIERKIGHLMRRRHGGRRARMRGRINIAADFTLLAAATNLARLATLGAAHTLTGWQTTPA
jgi:Transposase DDE domain/Transposase domain (DUF772)